MPLSWEVAKKVPPGLQELDFRAAEELALFRLALGISPTEMDALKP